MPELNRKPNGRIDWSDKQNQETMVRAFAAEAEAPDSGRSFLSRLSDRLGIPYGSTVHALRSLGLSVPQEPRRRCRVCMDPLPTPRGRGRPPRTCERCRPYRRGGVGFLLYMRERRRVGDLSPEYYAATEQTPALDN